MADQFKVNSADYTSAADALAAAVPDASGNISITAINGDLTLDSSVAATGKVILRVASADALIAGEDVSSTITITSDFTSNLDMQAGTDSENENLQGCTGENAPYRIILDGANVTGAAGFYSYNYGYVVLKNGAQYLGKAGDSHVRGSVLVTGEGTLLSAAFLSVYAADFGSTKPYAASMVVKDGATLFATTERTDTNTFKIGHASKAYRGGELIIEGGIVKSNTDIVVNAGGTISLSNSTVNGKVNYGQIIFTEKSASKLVTTSAAAGAVTISLKSADYANCDASYKIIDTQNTAALDLSKVTITLDGAAYTLGTTFGGSYSIKQVDNDLVLYYDDPYMLNSQNFVTDTTLSGTAKAYYRNPDENYSGFSSIYNVGSGSTLTIAEGVAVDLERNASGTKSIILVGANDYFASQGFEATGAGDLVVNGTLDVGQLNAMADGTITVNGELNITTACIEKGSLIYNTGSTGEINCLNIFNNANATVTVNGLATITLAGEPAHALKDNGATDIADRFIVNVTDAELADMTDDTHTILNVKSSDVSIADKFTLNVNGAAYTLGEEFSDANGSKYVINFADADGDSTANDLVIEVTVRKPDLSKSDVYVGNLTGKDGVAVHDTANKLTVFESDGTMSEGAVWGLGDWDMLDVADVNGDGADDILISYQHDNGVTGVAALINQQDGSYGMVHQDIRGWSNDLWEYLCSADVNGDGTEDILTIETDSIAAGRDKNVNAWIMDSTGQYSEDMRICGKNTDWEIEGFGDVTGDGKADGILRFKKLVAFWEHDGKNDSVLKEVGQMSTSWKVIGSDDFTGDGLADILFGNSSAQYKLWTDIDEKSYTEINLGTMKNSSLELAGIGDFNGDGKADILWQAADGGLHWGEAQAGKLNNLTTIA